MMLLKAIDSEDIDQQLISLGFLQLSLIAI